MSRWHHDFNIIILQTPLDRHLEDRVHAHAVTARTRFGESVPLCGIHIPRGADNAKRIKRPRIPTAAICPRCIATARRWYGDWAFEPFDCVQRQRLLTNLERDLMVIERSEAMA